MLHKVVCDICGSAGSRIIFDVDPGAEGIEPFAVNDSMRESDFGIYYPVIECEKCKLRYCSPRDDDETIRSYYRFSNYLCRYYEPYKTEKIHFFRKVIAHFDSRISGGRILDIGCSLGDFLMVAKEAGWDPFGVELNEEALEGAKKKGLSDLRHGSFEESGFEEKFFSAVALNDVVEHSVSPTTLLREIYRVLEPSGLLYISTPDAGSFSERILGRKWYGYRKIHIYYFSRKTIRHILEETGFEIEWIRILPKYFTIKQFIDRIEKYSPVLFKMIKPLLSPLAESGWILTFPFGDMQILARRPSGFSGK